MADEPSLYTGPLLVAASLGVVGEHDPGSHAVVLVGLARDCSQAPTAPPIRVRMEMTPEEAEDVAGSMLRLAKVAKEGGNDG